MGSVNVKKVAAVVVDKVRKGEKVAVSKIMKSVGYSQWYSKQPSRVTQTSEFQKILEDAGLTDEFLSKKHQELSEARTLRTENFEGVEAKSLTDEEIKEIIEMGGGTLIKIKRFRLRRARSKSKLKRRYFQNITVYYSVPEHLIQNRMVELAYKIKGHIVEKHAHAHAHIHKSADIQDKRKKQLDDILNEQAQS